MNIIMVLFFCLKFLPVYNKKEILYDRDPRAAGQTKWNYGKLINLSIDNDKQIKHKLKK